MQGTDSPPHEILLASLTGLMSRWSSLELQRRITAECGLTLDPVAVSAVYTLGLRGGDVRPSTIADALHLSRPSTSKLIARLSEAGLVVRSADARDRRAATVALTAQGQRVFRLLIDAGVTMVADATSHWSAADVATLSTLMQRFLDDIGAQFTADATSIAPPAATSISSDTPPSTH